MNRIIFVLITAVALLTGCATHKSYSTVSSVRSLYDERPENKQPVLERPAWPNYDLNNDRSFAAFSHIQTAPKDVRWKYLKSEEGNSYETGPFTLYRCKDATYLCYYFTVPDYQDWWFFRFTEGTAIIDADTGDRYLLQQVEHFPMGQCFWIYGQSNETICIVLDFPPLPQSVKRIQYYEASAPSRKWMNGTGVLTAIYNVDELRPYTVPPSKGEGRVIY